MKNIKLTLLCFLFLNASCAQKDNSIVSPNEKNYEIVNVYKDVDIPWSIEFLDENTIIYAEKKGEIYIVKNNTAVKVENVPNVYFRGQGGLLDLELHPDFKNNSLIYMSYASGSREQGGGNTAIARAKLIDNTLTDIEVLYKGEENSTKGQHYGSRLQFDKDGFLFFTIGDRGNRDKNPQNLELDGGKVYRILDDGSIPNDNPFIGLENVKEATYSFGHRNPQGMFKHPESGKIWTNEHGPRGGDEINIIEKGKNYGWPKITYGINYSGTTITKNKSLPNMEQPLYYWIPSIAPSSFEYISSEIYPDWKGSLLAGALVFKYIERIVLEDDIVVSRSKIAENLGRPRDIKQGPDGYIYVSIENKGVYKIIPKKWDL